MLALTIKSIRANKTRFVLTSVAIVLGVAFMVGTSILTDTIERSYEALSTNVYRSTDAVVRATSRTTDSNQQETRATVGDDTLVAVRSVPQVRVAEPQQLGKAVIVGRNGALLDANRNRAAPIALAWHDTPELNPMRVIDGHAPQAPDEIVIDRTSARAGRFGVGDHVRVVSQLGTQPYRIAGVATYAGRDDAAGAQVVAFTPQAASGVIGTPGRYREIQVVARDGVSRAQLVEALRNAIPDPGVEVITGTTAADETARASGTQVQFLSVFLMAFALVALVVGSFVIYNTFSITVAQRTKEIAVLRSLGASRRQVMRSVRFEAFFTGMFASAVGVVVGIATAQGLRAALHAFGVELPGGSVVIAPRTIVQAMVVGVVVTVVAAWLPSRRASRVAPMAALRDADSDPRPRSRRRALIGTGTALLGAFSMLRGLTGAGLGAVALGALAVFLGVAMLGPVIARGFALAVGAPLPHLRGIVGTIARDNAMRNPRRTSATASALMVGMALVAFVTVFAASAKASLASSVDKAMRSEFIVTTQFGMGGLSPSVGQRIDALPETGAVTPLRFAEPQVGGSPKATVGFDPARINENADLRVQAGDISQLGRNEIAVQTDEARTQHLGIGSMVTLHFAETGDQPFRVVALYRTKEPMGVYALSTDAFAANVADQVDEVVLVHSAPTYTSEQVRAAVERAIADTPTAELMTGAEFNDSMAGRIDTLLNLVYVLLAMALVIALFGIANTLALAVFERTREIGLLRAVGAGRAQIRSTVRWEAVLVALLGTALGTTIGLGFAAAVVHATRDAGINILTVPVAQLAVIAVCAALAAVAAAALPGRRAARLDVLAAIGSA